MGRSGDKRAVWSVRSGLGTACRGGLAGLLAATAPISALAQATTGFAPLAKTGEARIGGEGSWDYLAIDPARHHLFISRVGGTLVLDTRTMHPAGTIPALAGTRVHGVAVGDSYGITGDGKDLTATVFDLKTLAVRRKVALPHSVDAVALDMRAGVGFAVAEDDPRLMIFDPNSGRLKADVATPGSPESIAIDNAGAVYVDLSDSNEIAKIDPRTWTVRAHWAIGSGCETPTPMAIDRRANRLFVGCRSGVLAVIDPVREKTVATVKIGDGADTVVYDPASRTVFVSCNDGTLHVLRQAGDDSYVVQQIVPTAPGARTMAFDPRTKRVFLPVTDKGPLLPKVEDISPRPAIVPETFRVLTIGAH